MIFNVCICMFICIQMCLHVCVHVCGSQRVALMSPPGMPSRSFETGPLWPAAHILADVLGSGCGDGSSSPLCLPSTGTASMCYFNVSSGCWTQGPLLVIQELENATQSTLT